MLIFLCIEVFMLTNKKDLSFGFCLFFAALALMFYIIPFAVMTPNNVAHAVLSPKFWPNAIAWMLLLLGGGMLIKAFLYREEREATTGIAIGKWLRLAVFAAFLAAFYLLLPELGMIWGGSLAYLIFSLLICRTEHRVAAVCVGLMLPIALYMFFYHIAGVDIPQSDFMRLP
ncbi:tripartite tricarboxylate transporter TctB family protein [Amphritea sp. 2_MG-2023]|nr:tripartite tricarboxylate transporter TctB family protein [Amphritea atlantica]MDO6418969.1 tripartite tricarboxylate transporter TctB family protein [Amphritea sp. 2_MG-2023]